MISAKIVNEEEVIISFMDKDILLKKKDAIYKNGSTATLGLSMGMCGTYTQSFIYEGVNVVIIWNDGSWMQPRNMKILIDGYILYPSIRKGNVYMGYLNLEHRYETALTKGTERNNNYHNESN